MTHSTVEGCGLCGHPEHQPGECRAPDCICTAAITDTEQLVDTFRRRPKKGQPRGWPR